MTRALGQWKRELQLGGEQLLVVIVAAVLAAVVRVGAGWEDGAPAVLGERELQLQQWVRIPAVIGGPEELGVGGVPDGAVGHHGFRM
jgi:hypothetical protein